MIVFLFFMEEYFENFKHLKRIICACSGGADSMMLAFLLRKYLIDAEIHIVIINHKLRNNSTDESTEVEKYLLKNGFKVIILEWHHAEIKTQIEEKARKARQELIFKYAIEHSVEYIFLGHHADDVIENFFIKLEMQSGIFGLSNFVKTNKTFRWNGYYFNICRPLLSIYKKDILQFVIENNIFFVNDETNFTDQYKRSRLRGKMDQALNLLEIKKESIINSIKTLSVESEIIYNRLQNIFQEIVKFNDQFGFFKSRVEIYNLTNQELKFTLKQIIFYFTEKCEVRNKEFETAILKLKNKQKFTLGGILSFVYKEDVFFIKEPSKIKNEVMFTVWDKRFFLNDKTIIPPLQNFPKIILQTLPSSNFAEPIKFKIMYD